MIAKSEKKHPAAKKCCGWEEPAIYDAGVNNDILRLIYKANYEVNMAVKTPHGLTDRQKLKNTVLQGDKLSSGIIDKIGQECMKAGYLYNYKEIPPNWVFGHG